MKELRRNIAFALLAVLLTLQVQQRGCEFSFENPLTPALVPTQSVYVYDKNQTAVPSDVLAAVNELKRNGFSSSVYEVGVRDGDGQIPDQYKLPKAAAEESGLPAFVVMADEKVARIVSAPTTKEECLEAVQ